MLSKEFEVSSLSGGSPLGFPLEDVSSEAVGVEGVCSVAAEVEGVTAGGTGGGGNSTEKSCSNNNSPVLVKT